MIYSSSPCPKFQSMRPFSLSVCQTGAADNTWSLKQREWLFCRGGGDWAEDGGP